MSFPADSSVWQRTHDQTPRSLSGEVELKAGVMAACSDSVSNGSSLTSLEPSASPSESCCLSTAAGACWASRDLLLLGLLSLLLVDHPLLLEAIELDLHHVDLVTELSDRLRLSNERPSQLSCARGEADARQRTYLIASSELLLESFILGEQASG